MKKLLVVCVLFVLFAAGCSTIPYTGRKSIKLMSESEEQALGEEAYSQVLAESPLSKDEQQKALLEEVGHRLGVVREQTGGLGIKVDQLAAEAVHQQPRLGRAGKDKLFFKFQVNIKLCV